MLKAYIDVKRCVGCGACIEVCPVGAIAMEPGWHCVVNREKCIACGRCVGLCHRHAPIIINID